MPTQKHKKKKIQISDLEFNIFFYFCFLPVRNLQLPVIFNAMEAVKDKGVVVAVASPEDVDTANKDRPDFFQVKKAL